MNFKHLIVLTGLLFYASKSFANEDLGTAVGNSVKSITDGVTKTALSLLGRDGLVPDVLKSIGDIVSVVGQKVGDLTQPEKTNSRRGFKENDGTDGQPRGSHGKPGGNENKSGGSGRKPGPGGRGGKTGGSGGSGGEHSTDGDSGECSQEYDKDSSGCSDS